MYRSPNIVRIVNLGDCDGLGMGRGDKNVCKILIDSLRRPISRCENGMQMGVRWEATELVSFETSGELLC